LDQECLRQYAQLIVKTGVNIGEGQTLVIGSPIECAPITRLITETAYEAGAREVVVNWKDEPTFRTLAKRHPIIKYMHLFHIMVQL